MPTQRIAKQLRPERRQTIRRIVGMIILVENKNKQEADRKIDHAETQIDIGELDPAEMKFYLFLILKLTNGNTIDADADINERP